MSEGEEWVRRLVRASALAAALAGADAPPAEAKEPPPLRTILSEVYNEPRELLDQLADPQSGVIDWQKARVVFATFPPGKEKTRALVEEFVSAGPAHDNIYLDKDYFGGDDYAVLERAYGDPVAFATLFMSQWPWVFIEKVWAPPYGRDELTQTGLSQHRAEITPLVVAELLLQPRFYLRGGGYADNDDLLVRAIQQGGEYITPEQHQELKRAMNTEAPELGMINVVEMPSELVHYLQGKGTDVVAYKLDLIDAQIAKTERPEEVFKELEFALRNWYFRDKVTSPEEPRLQEQLFIRYVSRTFDHIGETTFNRRMPYVIENLVAMINQQEAREAAGQRGTEDYFRDYENVKYVLEAILHDESELQKRLVENRIANLAGFGEYPSPGWASIIYTVYIQRVVEHRLGTRSDAESEATVWDAARLDLFGSAGVKLRADLLGQAVLQRAIESYPVVKQLERWVETERLTGDPIYNARRLPELILGDAQANRIDMLYAYALVMSDRIEPEESVRDLIEEHLVTDEHTLIEEGFREREFVYTGIDADIMAELESNDVVHSMPLLIRAGIITRYDLQPQNRAAFAASLHAGYEHLYRFIAQALPRGVEDREWDVKKMTEYMFLSKYPLNRIEELLLEEPVLPTTVDQIWHKLGAMHTKSNVVSPEWENVPGAEWLGTGSGILWGVFDETPPSLRVLDLSNPERYARLLHITRLIGLTALEEPLFDSFDYTVFDAQVRERITQGEFTLLFKTIVEFANAVDTTLATPLLERVMSEHGESVRNYFSTALGPPTAVLRLSPETLQPFVMYYQLASGKYGDFPQVRFNDLNAEDFLKMRFDARRAIDVSTFEVSTIQNIEEWVLWYDCIQKLAEDQRQRWESKRLFRIVGVEEPDLALKRLEGEMLQRVKDLAQETLWKNGIPEPGVFEAIRSNLNASEPDSGNDVLMVIAESFIERNATPESVANLLLFARSWSLYADQLEERRGADRDVGQFYKTLSYFAFNAVVEVIQNNDDAFTSEDRERYEPILNEHGFTLVKDPSGAQKALTRILSGDVGYVIVKIGKYLDTSAVGVDSVSRVVFEKETHPYTSVEYLCIGETCTPEKASALLMLAEPDHARVRLESNTQGIVDNDRIVEELGREMFFSAPVAFSTGARRIIGMAYRNGERTSRLLKADGGDGLIVTNEAGEVIILNKRKLRLAELARLGVEVPEGDRERELDVTRRIRDFRLFEKLVMNNKLSVLENILLAEAGTGSSVGPDGSDSRRLFITMEDGRVGVIDSIHNMPTDQLVAMALKAGAKYVIYMDTGMYDSATVYFPDGSSKVVGLTDTSKSTNRVYISVK